jgi:REP-associated tyrosine transposase
MGHTYANILIHVIFSTKERAPSIRGGLRQRLYEYMAGVARQEFGKMLIIGGTADHVHGLFQLKTDVSVADAMRDWKSLSSGWVHETFPEASGFAWQAGYGAFSVSASNLARVRRYIEDQEAHHTVRSFQEEFVVFLKRHRVDYDPERIWD